METSPFSSQAANAAGDLDQTIRVRTPVAGAVYFNRYRLKRVLGRGGMGVVWLADDLKLERPVALKFLPSLIGLDPTAVKELKTETRQGLELSHPNIVRIYDFVDDEDEAAISMEFVDGKTLSELRATMDHGVFTIEQVAKWLPGVCEALDYAHFQRKVVHRDLKPSNIMAMSQDDIAKIADFGIARSISDTMQRLSVSQLGVSGTLPYMSPQQAMGERPSPTDDVYSLGATIYDLLSGKPPFYRGDIPSQLSTKVPSSMIQRREELEIKASDPIPKEWEAVIAACLQKDPTLRPPSAGKLLELLGLRSTTNAATQPFIPSAVKPQPEVQAKSHFPVYAAAAVAVLAAGAAYYFKSTTPGLPAAADCAVPAQAGASSAAPALAVATTSAPAASAPVVAQAGVPVASPQVTAAVTPAATPAPTATPAPATAPSPAMAAATPTAAPAPTAVATPTSVAPPPAPTVAAAMPAAAPAAVAPLATPAAPAGTAPAPAVVAQVMPAQVPVAAPPAGTPALAAAPLLPPAPAAPGQPQAAVQAMPATPVAATPAFAAALPPGAMVQPRVSEPTTGFWPIERIFPTPPQSDYSEGGRRHLLFEAQRILKEKSLYSSTQDGKEGKGTHNAIILYQAKNGLFPNGLLDGPTLASLSLFDKPDDNEWRPPPPANAESGGGFRRSRPAPQEKEDPSFLRRAGKSIGRFFNQDD